MASKRMAETAIADPRNPGAARAAYVRACDPEHVSPGWRMRDELRAELRRLAVPLHEPQLDALQRSAASWSSEETGRCLDLLDQVRDEADRAVLARRAALGCAPLAMVSGAWLQWLSAPGNADDPVTLRILELYACDVGVGRPRASRGSAYLTLLRAMALSEYATPPSRLALDERISDEAFQMPAVLLGMSRHPDDFRPEILGADLCLRSIGLLPPLALVRQALPAAADWGAIAPDTARQPARSGAVEQCRGVIDALSDSAPDGAAERVSLGFEWALAALGRWCDVLREDLDAARDPAYEMAELLRLRAREAAAYHQDFRLEDRPLSEWLRQCGADPGPLLTALAGSRLVKPGRSATSPLVCGLVSEHGPMFRVFAPTDLAVIRRWIDSLPSSGPGPAVITWSRGPAFRHPLSDGGDAANETAAGADGVTPASLREAYHMLQGRADAPALRRFALDYVRGWLARSRHGWEESEHQLPKRWTPAGLRPWLLEQHDRHARDFEAGPEGLPSEEALIDSTVQLAPLTLIDGAWLQGFTDYEHATSELGHFLFETYWDELGNGEPRLNHPLIYREVLAEMGVRLPPTRSREFAFWPGFRDASFELPVYWLSVGRFPSRFMPEVLGLNLAMELSGVGGTYRRARIALKRYGYSTRFVDIHNTIDNVAAGHSAWAADAVDAYLSTLPVSEGAGSREHAWQRVRVGYRSLNPPTGFWARRAGRRAQRSARPR